MKNTFTFDGRSCNDFGLFIENLPDAAYAERRGDPYQIAGRNGTLYREDGTFDNYEQTYRVGIRNFVTRRDVYQLTKDVAGWLIGSSGFCRLEDTYDPEVFRLARFAGPMNIQAVLRNVGRGALVFDCKPERYLKSGENAVTVMQNVACGDLVSFDLANPTGMLARPLIRVTGSGGWLYFALGADGDTSIHLGVRLDSRNTVIFDSEECTVKFEDGTEANSITKLFDDNEYPVWPVLWPNITTFRHYSYSNGGTIEKIEIIPRWWTI